MISSITDIYCDFQTYEKSYEKIFLFQEKLVYVTRTLTSSLRVICDYNDSIPRTNLSLDSEMPTYKVSLI